MNEEQYYLSMAERYAEEQRAICCEELMAEREISLMDKRKNNESEVMHCDYAA